MEQRSSCHYVIFNFVCKAPKTHHYPCYSVNYVRYYFGGVENYFFLENDVTLREPFLTMFDIIITRYQLRFYAGNYFE